MWNLWGGLIYLLAPRDVNVKDEKIVVQEAIIAPYYKSGECVSCSMKGYFENPMDVMCSELSGILCTSYPFAV